MLPALTLLRLVPLWAYAVAAAAVLAGLWHWGAVRDARNEGRAEVHAEWDRAKAQAASAALAATTAARAEEQRREAALRKEVDDANAAADRARADAGRAAAAAAGLRDAARAAAARCGASAGRTAAAGAGAPAGSGGDVLADVLGLVEQAGRDMAAEADRRGVAGRLCERAYDEVTR